MRLWVDTDVGTNPDDSIALLCALAHPDVELVGVSTVGSDAGWRAEVARRLVPGSVPVVAGAPAAVEAIPSAGADLVLGIGPLTNLAALAATGWRPVNRAVMGGALALVHHRGRIRRFESNFNADPRAAAVVLAQPGVTVVPLDATITTRVDPPALNLLLAGAPALVPAVEAWFAALADAGVPESQRTVHLHDPAALLVALGEPLAHLEPERLIVEGDGRLRKHPEGALLQVAVRLHGAAVVNRVLALIGAP
ncbi:MAG: nucleoside hydrolase [Acidimicrobiia bacterium]